MPQVIQVLAPHCAPRLLTAGLGESRPALASLYGRGMQAARRHAKGPQPKPRSIPVPELLDAQGGTRSRRQHRVGGKHRVVFAPVAPIESILAKRAWKSHASFVERLPLNLRQHGAAIGRRVPTLCRHEAGLRQPLTLFHAYPNFVLPPASLRLALPELETVPGTGAIKRWQQG